MTQLKYTVHLFNPNTRDYNLFERKTVKQIANLWSKRTDWYLTATRQPNRFTKIVFKAGVNADGLLKLTHNKKILAKIEANNLVIPISELDTEETNIATALGHMLVKS